MADNVTLDPGSGGSVIAADDISSVFYPRSKITLGADGVNDGDVSSANPLPVKGTGTAGTPNSGVVTVQGVSSMTPVQVGDNSGSLTIDAPVGTPAFVRLSDGSAAITTLPVSMAAIPTGAATSAKQDAEAVLVGAVDETAPATDTASSGLNGRLQRIAQRITSLIALIPSALTGSGNFKTSVQEALPAGTNAIGKLAANSGVDIGDVDVTSIAAGDNNIGNVDIVTVPTDPFGANADAASATGSISAKLRFIAATGIPVTGTVTVGSHAVTNAGTFATQVDGSALTALQKIDDPVLVDDAAFTPATSSVMMAGFECDETATDSVDEGDAGAARMTADRKVIVNPQPHTAGGLSMSSVIGAATTNATVVKASAGQVYEIVVTNINAAAVYLKLYNKATTPDENDTPVWRMAIPGNTAGAGLAKTFPNGLAFGTGISYRLVGAVADNSTTAVSASEQLVNVGFK